MSTNSQERPYLKTVRASFDIGSSSTKMQCCEYSRNGGINTLSGQERPVPFGANYLKSSDGSLSESIQLSGLAVLQELKAEAEHFGASEFSAIATEVFRKASNGNEYLDRVRFLGISVTVLTQELEARLGFDSALIMSGMELDATEVCVWDSGGASFQISSRNREEENGTYVSTFHTYMGSLGSSVCTAMLMREVQQRSYSKDDTPNPVSFEEASQLVDRLMTQLSHVPSWLAGKKEVVAVTGKNSIFKLCCNVLVELSKQDKHDGTWRLGLFRTDSLPDSPTITSFTCADAELALRTCTGCSDNELCQYVNFQYSDGPKVVVPKLCLLVAVMRHTGIQRVSTVKCIGSCVGVICNELFWEHE